MVDTSRWTLFVDEAGEFAEPKDHVVVAGVCIPARIDSGFSFALKHYLTEAAPLVPWPIHRRLMNRASSYVLWYAHRPSSNIPEPLQRSLEEAGEFLTNEVPYTFVRGLSSLEDGKEPEWVDLGALERVLRESYFANYKLIHDYADELKAAVASVVRILVHERLRVSDDPDTQPFVVFASESVLADAHESDDRYLVLLECLLERVWEEFDRREGRHAIDVHVATRKVVDPRMPLGKGDEKPLLSKSLVKHLAPKSANPLMLPERVWGFDVDVEPGVVFADTVNNYLHGVTKYQSLGISEIEGLIVDYFGITAHPGRLGLPQITASGIAWESIKSRKLMSGERAARVWAVEQAQSWIEFYTGGDQ